jgi:hypothetical protein
MSLAGRLNCFLNFVAPNRVRRTNAELAGLFRSTAHPRVVSQASIISLETSPFSSRPFSCSNPQAGGVAHKPLCTPLIRGP